jgi:FkbM family methyltransferase
MLLHLLKSPFYLLRLAFVAYRSRYRGAEQFEVFRVLAALWFKTTFLPQPTGICQQRLFGFTVAGNSYQLLLRLFKELFIAEPYAFTTTNTSPLILDCGANIGLAVLYFKKQFPDARILAFEPNPEAFSLLARNVAANNLRSVELYQVALADGTDGASLTGSLQAYAEGVRTVQVPARRLADYLGTTPTFDLLKLDVEGAEAAILADLSQAGLLRRIQRCIVEYHYPIGTAASAQLALMLQSFEKEGFTYFIKQVYPRTALSQEAIFELYQVGQV